MASLTEQLQEDVKRNTKDTIKAGGKTAQVLSKGIALVLNETVLSEASIMKALDRKVEKTGDIQYSYVNVTMEELQKGGKVEQIEEPVLKETMKYFDKYCRKYGVKYSALKTKTQDEPGKGEESFIVFFEGKSDKIMEHVIKNALSDWTKDQEKMKEAGKDMEKEAAEKPSVLAKLAFFRNRVKESVNQKKESEHTSEKTRTPEQER